MQPIYIEAFLGGTLLGLGAIMLLLFNGKVAGISGITFSAITSLSTANVWRWSFLLGLIVAPLVTVNWGFSLPTSIPIDNGTLALAGLIVGVGSKVGSGCTSGHGICGIGRLSKRSIVATITFMFSAAITVAVIRHLL